MTTEPLGNIMVSDTVRISDGKRTCDARVIANHHRHFVVHCDAGEIRFDYYGHSVNVNYKTVKRTGEWEVVPIILDGNGGTSDKPAYLSLE